MRTHTGRRVINQKGVGGDARTRVRTSGRRKKLKLKARCLCGGGEKKRFLFFFVFPLRCPVTTYGSLLRARKRPVVLRAAFFSPGACLINDRRLDSADPGEFLTRRLSVRPAKTPPPTVRPGPPSGTFVHFKFSSVRRTVEIRTCVPVTRS